MLRYRSYPHRQHAPRLLVATALLALVALALWAAGPSSPVQAQPTTVTFEYTGRAQTWTVPTGVTEAVFDVYGAQGGNGEIALFPSPGGTGGRATARLQVTPGDGITIMVGGKGHDYTDTFFGGCDHQDFGGFNGGGAGGQDQCSVGGGGGASDVRIGGTDLTHRVLVAGGGGGGARNGFCPTPGAGGGLTGTSGQCAGEGGGAGGNQDGTSGSGQLGQGGRGQTYQGNTGGGGGGGGYYGGAGGGIYPGGGAGMSGGGGSGFGPAGTTFQTGVQQGHGRVIVTYALPPPPVVNAISPALGPTAGGTSVTITGANLTSPIGPTTVTFGSAPATSVRCASTTQCTATSPAGTGTVTVTVTVLGQSSQGTVLADFTYLVPPKLTGISPNEGPAAGGTVVTLTGTDLAGDVFVLFGLHLATKVSCTVRTTCTVVSPPGAGTVQVQVETIAGLSNTLAFTYRASGTSPTPTPSPTPAPVPTPTPRPRLPPAPTPLAVPPLPPQPMTVTVTVRQVLLPLVSEGQIAQTVLPAPGRQVAALIGGTVCGQGVTDSQGRARLSVAAEPTVSGCGRDGAGLSFQVNGVSVRSDPLTFRSGGQANVAVAVP